MYYNLQTWRLPLQAHWAPLQIMRQLWHLALLHLQQTPLDLGEQVDAVFCNLFFKYLDLVKHWSNVSFPPLRSWASARLLRCSKPTLIWAGKTIFYIATTSIFEANYLWSFWHLDHQAEQLKEKLLAGDVEDQREEPAPSRRSRRNSPWVENDKSFFDIWDTSDPTISIDASYPTKIICPSYCFLVHPFSFFPFIGLPMWLNVAPFSSLLDYCWSLFSRRNAMLPLLLLLFCCCCCWSPLCRRDDWEGEEDIALLGNDFVFFTAFLTAFLFNWVSQIIEFIINVQTKQLFTQW